jgi:hypothetical protein
MKHWQPDRHRRFPPGWWVFPALFAGLFIWSAIYLAIDWLI